MAAISVITVTFNCAELVERTIQSVVAQKASFPGLEYIVIDGGSTDGTMALIEKYRPDIDYFISEPDGGIYDAMNKGIQAAHGEWLIFLNAGDYFHPEFRFTDLSFAWPSTVEFVAFPFQIEGELVPHVPTISARAGLPSSHQATFVASKVAKDNPFKLEYRVAADFEMYLGRLKCNPECVFPEKQLITCVQPGGFSLANANLMQSEYLKIIFKHRGALAALIHYARTTPRILRMVKFIFPVGVFNKMRSKWI